MWPQRRGGGDGGPSVQPSKSSGTSNQRCCPIRLNLDPSKARVAFTMAAADVGTDSLSELEAKFRAEVEAEAVSDHGESDLSCPSP